jgi:hypothetical protein
MGGWQCYMLPVFLARVIRASSTPASGWATQQAAACVDVFRDGCQQAGIK